MRRRDFIKIMGSTIISSTLSSNFPFISDQFPRLPQQPTQIPQQGGYDPPSITDLDKYDFILPRIRLNEVPYHGRGMGTDKWNVRPAGDANLLKELEKVIRVKVKHIKNTYDWQPHDAAEGQLNAVLSFDDYETIRHYSFLFMTSENQYKFTDTNKKNLEKYILSGGFILMDDCVVASGGDFFYRCSYEIIEDIFGLGSVKVIPKSHEVFNNVYDMREVGLPHLEYAMPTETAYIGAKHGQNYGARGLFINDRLAVLLSSTDLHCGWVDSHDTQWAHKGYQQTIQMGINIILYALTH